VTIAIMPPPIDASNGLYITAIGEVQEQQLVDGSVLQLNTDSQVQVSFNQGMRKIRLLKGEAHFEVAPDKQWPFQVYAGNGMVKAVGTAFSVRLNPEQVNVVVSEGVVDIASIRPSNQNQAHSQQPIQPQSSSQAKQAAQAAPAAHKLASLRQGQAADISNHPEPATELGRALDIQQIPAPELERKLAWRSGYLVFVGDPLSQVITEISRYTPISIQLASPEMADIRVGGRFKVGELNAMLEVLESSFGLQVSYLDDHRIQLQLAEPANGSL
jgi:transmembrane sensor